MRQFLFASILLLSFFSTKLLANQDDFLKPGWTGNYKYGIGFSSSFTPGNNAFIFDYYSSINTSYAFHIGFSKTASTYQKSESSDSTTKTITNTGASSMAILPLAFTYYQGLFRNDFTNVRLGAHFGTRIFFDTEYEVGEKEITLGTGVEDHNNFGKAEVSQKIQFYFGPVLSTALNIRWIPMITVGMDAGILYFTNSKKETTTTTTDGVGGATQTNTTATLDSGPSSTTFGNGLFNLFGNFNIRYVW